MRSASTGRSVLRAHANSSRNSGVDPGALVVDVMRAGILTIPLFAWLGAKPGRIDGLTRRHQLVMRLMPSTSVNGRDR